MPRSKQCWIDWAEQLRIHMMTSKLPEIVKLTIDIHSETKTHDSLKRVQSQGFWNSCQRGDTDWDALKKAGFELDFVPNPDGKVEAVTFRLNETWLAIMQDTARRVEPA